MPDELELTDQELPPDHRSGYVVLAGKPNVGKSTLLNAWLDYRVAAVSPKPQTTRTSLLGILTRPEAQVVFVDTPGIHEPRSKLGEYMVGVAKEALADADVVLFIVDVSEPPTHEDRQIARLLSAHPDVPIILVLNKADLLQEDTRQKHRSAYELLGHADQSISISATRGDGCDELLQRIIARLPLGPRYYPSDQLTDQEERFIAAELIREQALKLLEQEVPHALAVVVQEFKERPNQVLYIAADIYTEKDSQKGIVIGQGGAMLKRIGHDARLALEEFMGQKVFLELWVKVRKNWRHSEHLLRQLGYSTPKR
jgi:GTP-binding protein Era